METKKRKINPSAVDISPGLILTRIKNTLEKVAKDLEEYINEHHNFNKEIVNVPESTYTAIVEKDSGQKKIFEDMDLENVKIYLNYKQQRILQELIKESKKKIEKPGNLTEQDIRDKEIGKSKNYKKYINDTDRYNSHLEARNIVSSVKRASHRYGGSQGKELFLRLSKPKSREESRYPYPEYNPKGTIDGSKKKTKKRGKIKKRKSSVNSSKKHKR